MFPPSAVRSRCPAYRPSCNNSRHRGSHSSSNGEDFAGGPATGVGRRGRTAPGGRLKTKSALKIVAVRGQGHSHQRHVIAHHHLYMAAERETGQTNLESFFRSADCPPIPSRGSAAARGQINMRPKNPTSPGLAKVLRVGTTRAPPSAVKIQNRYWRVL